MRTPSAVMNIGMLVLFPLTFASNVFVDPQTMPGWLRDLVQVNPVTHLVTAERGTHGRHRNRRPDRLGARSPPPPSPPCSHRSR